MSKTLKLFRSLVILFFFIFFWFLAEIRTDGFRTSKIMFDLPTEWRIHPLSKEENSEINNILSQSFTYLGRGRQCFVFESADQKYVLKFINYNNVSYPSFLKAFPIGILKNSLKRRDERYPLTFSSMVLAFENLQKETGLVYVHLDDVKFKRKVLIKNKYGQALKVDLDKTCFILQKKAKPLFSSLEEFYLKEKEAGLKKAIDEFLNVVVARCKKNIADDDFNAEMNIGFYKEKALIIDTGKLYTADLQDKEIFKNELFYSTKFLKIWLEKHHQEALPYLEKKIAELL